MQLRILGLQGATSVDLVTAATARLSVEEAAAILTTTGLSTAQQMQILMDRGLTKEEAAAALATAAHSAENVAATATTGILATATASLKAALKGLWATLTANPLLLVAASVAICITAFNKLNSAAEESYQKAAEQAQKSKEVADNSIEEANSLSELIEKYKELAKSDMTDSTNRAEIKNIQDEITKLVGAQADNLDLVNGKLDEELAKLKDIQSTQLQTNISTFEKAYVDAADEASKKTFHKGNIIRDWYADNNVITFDYWGDDENRDKAAEIIDKVWEEKGYGSAFVDYEEYILGFGDRFTKLIFNADLTLQDKINAINDAIDALENTDGFDYNNNQTWKKLVEIKDALAGGEGVFTKQVEAAKTLLDELTMSEVANNNADIDSLEDYEKYRQEIIDNITNNKTISQAIKDKALSSDAIETEVDNYLGTLEGFSKYYNEWYDKFASDTAKGAEEVKNRFRKSIESNTENFDFPKEIGESVGGAFENLISAKGDKDNPEFIDRVNDYVDSISALDDAFEKFQKGELENKDIVKLIEDFPQLTGRTEDLDVAINELKGNLNNTMLADFAEQFGKMETEEDVAKLEAFQNQVLELGGVVGSTAFSIDIDVEADNMDKLYSAMKESVTSTGLTADSIQNLINRYQNLKDFNANELFEKTANGIHLNTKELRQLESEYENQIKTANNLELVSLTSQYENLTEQIKNCDDATKVADLYAKRQDILDQIDDTATLAAQYDGLTSSFKKWEEAQSLGEEGDMYDSLQGGLEHIKELYDEGLIGTNEFRAAVQLMSNEDLSTASIDELLAAYDKGYEKMTRYFTESSDGCLNFLNDVSQLNSEWVKLNDDGSWDINFGVGDDADVAEKLGLDIETVQAIMRKLSDYGFDINLDSIFTKLDYLQDELTTATDKLKELGLTKTNFDFDTNSIKDVNSQIDEAQKLVDGFKDKKGKIDLSVEGAMEAETVLIGLMNRKQELSAPTVMHVDVSEANDDITNLISYLKDYQTNYNDIELKTAIGADTSEAETNIGETLTKINEIPKEVKTKLGLDDKDFTDAVSNIQADVEAGVAPKQEDLDTVQKTISEISPEMMVKAGLDSSRIDNYEPKDKTASVEYTSPSGQAIKDYQNSIDKWQPQSKTATITYNPVVNSLGGSITSWISGLFSGGSKANGTAYVNGTAKAKGDWRTKEDGEALGGELGQEMVVRDGRFFTIGDNGAEFFKYKKGDIIFNAEQTRQILKNGKITSGKKRGTALAEGTAFSSGSGKITAKGNVITTPSGSNNSDSSNSKDSSNDSTQTIDYVEIAIDRIQRAVNKLKKVAESAFKSLKKRLNATSDEIEKINEQIAVQNTAYSTYMAKANSINLSSSIKQAVRNGSYSITDYDSDTASLINEYKQYYEAALDCKEAVQDLNNELAQLYKDKFDLIEQDFDNQLSRMENKANHMESQISLLEAQNYFVSSKYYKKLANQEQNNIAMLNDKYASLQEALDEAVNSGKISKYSEEWYNMTIAIEDTKAAIDDATVSLAEYEDKMREIDWSVFDYLQDRISQINSESDFLIDLMSNSDMFDEVGNFTDKGLATAGLHGVNYNTYMAQADKYAKELIHIQNQLADDPADTRLIERKEELLDLQQQSIKNAEEEKQAIKSLVEDGIKVQLDSLQDLIKTYTDSLDKAKSFYDYQNKIEDKTSAIAEIQKQLAAYENNVSEETQAKVQKLKIDLVDAQKELAETEYEQYINYTSSKLRVKNGLIYGYWN